MLTEKNIYDIINVTIFRIKECPMKEVYVNLDEAINYLVERFYLTDRQFSCTRTKIGKLLSIVAFKYALEGEKLFKETIYEYNGCGTIIYEVMDRFDDGDIYTRIRYNDGCKIIDKKEIDMNAEVPNEYRNYKNLSDKVKKDIDEVFRNFGAYSQSELGKLITSLLCLDGVVDDNGEVNLEQVSRLNNDSLKEKNALIIFLSNIKQ